MTTERSDPPPPRSAAPALQRRPARSVIDDLAARAMAILLLLIGGLLTASALLERGLDPLGRGGRWRLVFGAALLLAAALAWWLRRQRRPRAATGLALTVVVLACGAQAWANGLGLYSIFFVGAVLAIGLAGVLASPLAAVGLSALHLANTLALFVAERSGALSGLAALAPLSIGSRLLGHLLLLACGLLASLVVARLFSNSLGRALDEERRLDELLHMGSDWIWESDASHRLTYISPSFEARSGRSVAEFMRLGNAGGPVALRDADFEQLRHELHQRRPYRDRVITFRCPDGALLCISGSGEPRLDSRGRLVGWWGVGRNVTAERLAQQELRRSQAMLDRLVRLSPDPISVARLRDGRILLVNAGFLQYSGLSEAQVVGRSAVELGLWRDVAEAQRLAEALRGDGMVRNLRSVVHLGEVRRDVLLTAAAFEWDGEPVAVITTRDITDTERARAEGDAILDNASVGIALVRERRFERVNPPFETMFGRAVGTLAGQPSAVLFPDPAQYEAFAARSDQAQRLGKAIDIEREVVRPDGSVLLARLRARAVDERRPCESGAIWVAEDITERRRAERELADAKQQAEAASHAKSAFLATMSHEIRTPLNGVLGLARLLQDPGLEPTRRREYLGHLVDAAELLTGIVSDVLDLSKIEAGHLQIEDIAFDLHGVVTSTFHTFAPLGREHGLAMRCSIAAEVPRRVRGDPVRVRQILANYLTNALKFTSRGEVAVQLAGGADGRIRIEVRDSGIGVTAEVRERLFRPFAQADSSTTRRFGGTGLGLSICRELAQRMGGTVGVDSDGASGSVFWAELVLPAEAQAAAGGDAGAEPVLLLAGLIVLVAEDNPVNMLIVGALLRRLGAEVLEADDGAKALALAREQVGALHAVLMDLHMPVVDGLAATRLLRADPLTAALPVFALSAAVLDHERLDASAAGMDGFVAKPVVEADLLRVLRPLMPAAD